MHTSIPRDPAILLSFLNLKLRDYYADLDTLCDDLELDKHTLEETLQSIDYTYDPAVNQFI